MHIEGHLCCFQSLALRNKLLCTFVYFFFVCVNVNFYFPGVNTQQCNCWAIWRLCGYMGLFLNPQLFSPDLFVFFTSIPHYLHCCCLVLSFENRNTNPVFFFKNISFFNLFFYVCICAWSVEVRGQLSGGQNQTQFIRLGRKYLYQPCHLA